MPQVITPSQVIAVTREGEIKVTLVLELNINLNSPGEIAASVKSKEIVPEQLPKSRYEDVDWEMPELTSGVKIDFGKQVKE